MKTDVFGYNKGEKPLAEVLPQGFLVHWNKEGKRQMWVWGFDKEKLTEKSMKEIVTKVLEDIKNS